MIVHLLLKPFGKMIVEVDKIEDEVAFRVVAEFGVYDFIFKKYSMVNEKTAMYRLKEIEEYKCTSRELKEMKLDHGLTI